MANFVPGYASQREMRKVLVHLHIYYHDQTGYFLEKLANISGCEWDLFVTMNILKEDTVLKLKSFKPDVKIIEVENRGYDIWPFIKVLKSVSLDDYDYILKLHTKNRNPVVNRVNGLRLKNYMWRNELVDSLLKSRKHFLKILDDFERHPKIGLMCSHLLYKKTSDGLKEDLAPLDNELKRLGLDVKERKFCAGTMFIARSAPYKRFQQSDIDPSIFAGNQQSHSNGSMSHVYERILTMIITVDGYKVKPLIINTRKSAYITFTSSIQPVLQKIFSIQRRGEKRIKTITFLGCQFNISIWKRCRYIYHRNID